MKEFYIVFMIPASAKLGYTIQKMNHEPDSPEAIQRICNLIQGDDEEKPIIINWKELKKKGGKK